MECQARRGLLSFSFFCFCFVGDREQGIGGILKEMKRRSLSNGKQLNRLGSSFKKDHIVFRTFERILFLSSFSPPYHRYSSANLKGRVRRNRYVPTVYNLASLSESSALSLSSSLPLPLPPCPSLQRTLRRKTAVKTDFIVPLRRGPRNPQQSPTEVEMGTGEQERSYSRVE